MRDYNNPEDLGEAILKQFSFTSNIVLPKAVVDNLAVTCRFDEAIQSWACQLSGWIWKEDLRKESQDVIFIHPATWWDMFKERFFPKIWLTAYPINYVTTKKRITMSKAVVYPKLALIIPEGAEKFTDHVLKVDMTEEPIQ